MKKLKLIVTSLLMGILLFALASCGGASGTLSSFIGAVKKADLEKAATYVVGNPKLTNPSSDSEIAEYIFDKTAGSFSYKVEDSDMNEEGTVCTIEIEYSGYSGTELTLKMLLKEKTKGMVDETLKTMEKKEGDLTVKVVKSEENGWQLDAVSAAALVLAIYG